MFKNVCVSIVFALLLCGAAWADAAVETGSADDAACVAATADMPKSELSAAIDAAWEEELDPGYEIRVPAQAPIPPLFPCPTPSTCTGGGSTCSNNPANCQIVGPISVVDTGQSSCLLPNGSQLRCLPGRTIHIKSAPCGQCPCCSGNPACLCPVNCGTASKFACI